MCSTAPIFWPQTVSVFNRQWERQYGQSRTSAADGHNFAPDSAWDQVYFLGGRQSVVSVGLKNADRAVSTGFQSSRRK